jgi:hypothetical protein
VITFGDGFGGVFYMPKLKFEKLDVGSTLSARVSRAKIPGGWLLIAIGNSGGGLTFYSDPQHKWDGTSLADEGAKATHAAAAARAS